MVKRVVNRVAELISIKNRRDNRRWKIEEIAEATGLMPKTVHAWLHNSVRRFDEKQLLAFATFLEVEVSELLTTQEEDENLGNMEAAIPA
jgi:transcriptional regulator with XRE-family HTH domain